MIASFSLAISQLNEKPLQKPLWIGLVGAFILFLVLWSTIGYILLQTELLSTGWFFGIFDWLFIKLTNIFGNAIVFFITLFLFPTIVTLIITFFLEPVIQAVEQKHYPNLPEIRQQRLLEICIITLKFAALSIILNILVIPLYLVFFFLGPFNLIIFYLLNGYLFGREYFELVSHRRQNPNKVRDLYRNSRLKIFIAGIIITFLMTIPIINLMAPIISTAAMVHLLNK